MVDYLSLRRIDLTNTSFDYNLNMQNVLNIKLFIIAETNVHIKNPILKFIYNHQFYPFKLSIDFEWLWYVKHDQTENFNRHIKWFYYFDEKKQILLNENWT